MVIMKVLVYVDEIEVLASDIRHDFTSLSNALEFASKNNGVKHIIFPCITGEHIKLIKKDDGSWKMTVDEARSIDNIKEVEPKKKGKR